MPKEREGPIIANQPIIYAISDSIGETSESVVRATTSQFVQEKFDIIRVPYVNSIEQIDKIVQEAKESNAVICYTIVSPEIRAEVARKTQELNVTAVDILGPVLTAIEKTSGLTPKISLASSMPWIMNISNALPPWNLPSSMMTGKSLGPYESGPCHHWGIPYFEDAPFHVSCQ